MKYLVFITFFFLSCADATPNQKSAKTASEVSGKLVHTVLFKLKPDADIQVFIKSLETLKTIEVVKKVEIGTFQDTGNPTPLSEYHLIVQMTFDDLSAFRVYETHPVHLASRENTKNLLAGAPMGYDFIKK